MSVVRWLAPLGPAMALSLSCGGAESLSLCRILPDEVALGAYCTLDLARATFGDVANAFHLATALDSTHQSLVALQSQTIQLSFGSQFLEFENRAGPVVAAAPVRSVMMRRYFATSREATDFLATLRQRIEASFSCVADATLPELPAMNCRDLTRSTTSIRYLWTNWADDPNAKAPFEITITARLE